MSFTALAAAVVLAVPAGGVARATDGGSASSPINVSNAGRAIPSFAILVVGTQIFGLRDVPIIGSWFVFAALVVLAVPPDGDQRLRGDGRGVRRRA